MAKLKLTDDVHRQIVEAIEAGNYAVVAAESAGISETTFYRWLEEGEQAQSGKKREFWESVTRAKGVSETNLLAAVKGAVSQDWRAATWMLERRFSGRWANTQKVTVEVEKELDAALDKLESTLDPEDFQRIAAILASGEES